MVDECDKIIIIYSMIYKRNFSDYESVVENMSEIAEILASSRKKAGLTLQEVAKSGGIGDAALDSDQRRRVAGRFRPI